MSKDHIIKRGDTFYGIFQEAKKQDKDLSYDAYKEANSHIKNPGMIMPGTTIHIPKGKPKSSVSAAPKQGKCGNEFYFGPRGKKASALQVKCMLNGKSTPALEADETFVLERELLDESQQGSLDLIINGDKHTLIEDLSKYKEQIGKHKDVKVTMVVVDQEDDTPAMDLETLKSLKEIPEETAPRKLLQPENPLEQGESSYEMHYQKLTQTSGDMTCTLERLGYTSDDNIFVFESRHCATLPPKGHIDTISELQKRELALSILNNSYLSGLPPATKDTVDNFGIIKDHLFNRGWNGEYYTKPAKTGGTLIILKGLPAKREYLDMTRIKASNAKAGLLGVATGVAKGEGAALIEATGLTSKFNIGFVLAVETAKWYLNDDPFGNKSDLAIAYGTAFAKFAAAGVIATLAVGLAASAITILTSGTIVVGGGIIILSVIIATIGVGFFMEEIDTNLSLTKSLQESWNKNIEPTVEKYIDEAGDWVDETADEMSEYFNDLAEKMTRLGR